MGTQSQNDQGQRSQSPGSQNQKPQGAQKPQHEDVREGAGIPAGGNEADDNNLDDEGHDSNPGKPTAGNRPLENQSRTPGGTPPGNR